MTFSLYLHKLKYLKVVLFHSLEYKERISKDPLFSISSAAPSLESEMMGLPINYSVT